MNKTKHQHSRLTYFFNLIKGFTLVELLVVIAIIGILASLAITSFQFILVRAQDSRNKALAGTVGSAISQYGVDHDNKYPVAVSDGGVLLSTLENNLNGYLKTNAALTQATGVAKYTSNSDGTSFVAGWELKYANDPPITTGNGVYQTNSAQNAGSVTGGRTTLSDGIAFSGQVVDDAYPVIEIPNNASYNSNFTATFWVKPSAFSGPFPAFNKTALIGRTNYVNNGWLVSFDNTGLVNAEMLGGQVGFLSMSINPPKLNLNSCNFMALTWDGYNLDTYNLTNSQSRNANYRSVPANNNPIVIGNPNNSFDYFEGNVDDLRIYNTVLNGTQLDQLYNLSQGGKGAYGGLAEMGNTLIGGWRMDDAGIVNPSQVKDYSITANDGATFLTSWSTGCTSLGLSGLGSSLSGKAFVVYGPQ
ncbi:MAG: prepilin-type N-terminal cleavage/methylation domain-containing protein [Candidatus Berkelbacteria bacterium]|nr:prepilin-type N-terminal cleavage/methylation domain-containing protein [Candidatus Berkelbacteria bacterium]